MTLKNNRSAVRQLLSSLINETNRLSFELRNRYWRIRTSGVGVGCRIYPGVRIRSPRGVRIGDGCVINDFVHIWGAGGVRIGSNTIIAAHSVISSQSHDVDALSKERLYKDTEANSAVVIGSNVWISSGAIIGPGVVIGDDTIIAAGAVVLDDMPARALVVGAPARVKRRLV